MKIKTVFDEFNCYTSQPKSFEWAWQYLKLGIFELKIFSKEMY